MPEHLGTILNVNDHEQTRYMISRMLRVAGFEVVEAASGEEALRLAALQPDLIVLDVKLPDISGFEICRMLKSREETAPIAILQTSATFVTTEKRVEGLDAGADAYLTHPFEQAELVATVKALLRLRRAEQELRRRADALETADRRKDEFLAMLAHELRNPLAAIAVAIPLIEKTAGDARAKRLCEVMSRQSKHLARLIDDLLDVARITQGKITLRKKPIAIGRALEQTLQGSGGKLTRKSQTLVLSAPKEELFVDADESRLEQILSNLIENASKYSDEGARIEVSLRRDQRDGVEHGVVRVTDQGIGISAELLPRVFDLFVQADHSLERTRGGMGIGLTLVKRLVHLHGGQVLATSEGLGRGSVFEVWLPLTEARPAAEQSPASSEVPTKARRILLVEDNEDARETLKLFFESQGHTVDVAGDGTRGVALAVSGTHDVAIVDVGLPGLDGYEVATQIRARLSVRVPLIALTGYGGEEQRARALRAGFDDHVVKPPVPEDLLERIERLLAAASRARTAATA